LDDLVNFIPARLTAGLFVLAARSVPGADAQAAWAAARGDAARHASPNAGWPEAAMAGAPGVGLGGPRAYGGEIVDLPQTGDGRRGLPGEGILGAGRWYARAMPRRLGGLGVWALGGVVV